MRDLGSLAAEYGVDPDRFVSLLRRQCGLAYATSPSVAIDRVQELEIRLHLYRAVSARDLSMLEPASDSMEPYVTERRLPYNVPARAASVEPTQSPAQLDTALWGTSNQSEARLTLIERELNRIDAALKLLVDWRASRERSELSMDRETYYRNTLRRLESRVSQRIRVDAAALAAQFQSYGYFVDSRWLEGIRATVESSQLLIVRGPSGSGKSTFARALARATGSNSSRPYLEKQVDSSWDAMDMIGYVSIANDRPETCLGVLAEAVFEHANTGHTWLILNDAHLADPSKLFAPLFGALDAPSGKVTFEHENLFGDEVARRTRVPLPEDFKILATVIGDSSFSLPAHLGLNRRAGFIDIKSLDRQDEVRALLGHRPRGVPRLHADLHTLYADSLVQGVQAMRSHLHPLLRQRLTVGIVCRHAVLDSEDGCGGMESREAVLSAVDHQLARLVREQFADVQKALLRDAATALEALEYFTAARVMRSTDDDAPRSGVSAEHS